MPLRPESEAELAEILRGAEGPLALRGGGTRGPGVAGQVLDLGGLRGVTLYEPGALTLVARAGTPLTEITALLASGGQRLAFEPPDLRALLGRSGESTIGGVVAANASGPRRVQAGACRDFLLGVRFVAGDGRLIRNGGRVMKNVTGYDLVKLLAGSHGTLGALTEVSLKVLPAPAACATLRIDGLTPAAAVDVMSRALGTPWEVTGAAHLPGGPTWLRVEGLAAQVDYRAGRLRDMLSGVITVDDPWPAIRDVAPFHQRDGDVWRLALRPSAAVETVARAGALAAIYDQGGGLVWLLTEPGRDLRRQLGTFSGHATLVRGSGQPVFQPEAPAVAALSRGLRRQFDPHGILNTGLMGI